MSITAVRWPCDVQPLLTQRAAEAATDVKFTKCVITVVSRREIRRTPLAARAVNTNFSVYQPSKVGSSRDAVASPCIALAYAGSYIANFYL